MAWEVFERTGRGTASSFPTVTLNAQQQLIPNRYAVEALGNPEYVSLLWDKQARAIGIRPATKDATAPLRCTYSKKHIHISARGFCLWAGITADAKGRWRAELIDGVLTVPLVGERVH